ncbi:MAG: ABC transporter ATP-binding protein [Chlamydiae bacterium]|nr:ABC transporter ATP-binding protein [Chlamydiota bacterium]
MTHNLGKNYRIRSAQEAGYKSFREELSQLLKNLFVKKQTQAQFWALQDINLTIWKGESIGIIGSNGSGKSTLLKLFSRITWPTTGSLKIYGKIGALLEVGTGFHPELTGKENIYLSGAILGMRRKEISNAFEQIVQFSEIESFLNVPVKRYSNGMFLRLAFSVMAHLRSDILIIDEILAVGDQVFQNKCIEKMQTLSKEGRTLIVVSHTLETLAMLCTRLIWIEKGRVILDGPTLEVINQYQQTFSYAYSQ